MTGIIPINKPSGKTSNYITTSIKRKLNVKTGHFGTLDPMADGVLPIMTGSATKLSDFFCEDKEYIATVKLGTLTDTGDITGKVISEEKTFFDAPDIKNVLGCFIGNIRQLPPMYSAIKVDGKRLYELARKGIEQIRKEREIKIYDIEFISMDGSNQTFKIRVSCSKGTYIRTLAEDIAAKLGTVGTLAALTRTISASIKLDECVSFDEFMKESNFEKYIISPETLFSGLNKITIPESGLNYFLNGGEIGTDRIENYIEANLYLAYSKDNRFLGLAKRNDGEVKTVKAAWIMR